MPPERYDIVSKADMDVLREKVNAAESSRLTSKKAKNIGFKAKFSEGSN